MNIKSAFVVLQVIVLCFGKPSPEDHVLAATKPTPTEQFTNVWQIDSHGKYWLFWKSNATHITFETHAKTKGYVGFGLSSNGKMFPSDVVVGWVDSNGMTHFKDCHTVGHSAPVIDSSQDYTLLLGKEDNFGTVLKFTRKLDTCDDNDYHITDDTIKVIWSYHPDDPVSFSSLPWHGDRRGAKSLMLLSAVKENSYVPPADAEYFDILHDNFHVPATDTTYQCKVFKVPQKSQKHHMIRFEPIITPGNENHVHHVVVYDCPTAIDDDVGLVFDCYGKRPHKRLEGSCYGIILAWAIGGVAFDFPMHAGYSFNSPGDPRYLIMETHFDNPTLKSDIVDSSGFRITLTSKLRQYDAGTMEIGSSSNELLLIPPHEKSFLARSYCRKECLQRGLKKPTDSVQVFAAFLHAHLIGVEISARHIRGDVELKPLAEDKNYDFDYQDTRILKTEREIKHGDSLTVDCIFDSTGRTKPTKGGLSTSDEMCLAFLYYYPRIPVSLCVSQPLYSEISKNPTEAARQVYSWDWNDRAVRDKFKELLPNTTYFHYCYDTENIIDYTDYAHFQQHTSKMHEPAMTYSPPPRQCPAK